jgi:hypothetical protein
MTPDELGERYRELSENLRSKTIENIVEKGQLEEPLRMLKHTSFVFFDSAAACKPVFFDTYDAFNRELERFYDKLAGAAKAGKITWSDVATVSAFVEKFAMDLKDLVLKALEKSCTCKFKP